MFVYGIVDANEPEELRYVGLSVNPRKRLSEHRNDAHWTFFGGWVQRLLLEGGRIDFVILAEVSDDRDVAHREEIRWIRWMFLCGHPLMNTFHLPPGLSGRKAFYGQREAQYA